MDAVENASLQIVASVHRPAATHNNYPLSLLATTSDKLFVRIWKAHLGEVNELTRHRPNQRAASMSSLDVDLGR